MWQPEEILKHVLPKILIVDDIPANSALIRRMLADYTCEIASDGPEALDKMSRFLPDLVLLDVVMPTMDGFEVCKKIKSDPMFKEIPVVMITALDDRESKLKGLDVGADEFLTKPIDPAELKLRTRNLLKVKEYQDFLSRYNQILQEKVAARTRALEASYSETIGRLSMAAEFKDSDTGLHIRRISHYSRLLGELLGLPTDEQELLSAASPMHDIGKIGIPDSILMKPGPLSLEEIVVMKTHTTIGGRILENASSQLLRTARIIALCHHEKWDGSGYPFASVGEEIPLEARIVSLADHYDALRSHRPYKPSFPHERTIRILSPGDGRTKPSHFDPQILHAFLAHHQKFEEIFESLKEDSHAAT